MRILTTKNHKDYWKNRKIDWDKSYLSTWDHPHRLLIIEALKSFHWFSIWEVGCGPGANLVKIFQTFMDGKPESRQIGGNDINKDAIDLAMKVFNGGTFQVAESDNLIMSDKSVDVVLSDAHLIYYGPTKINKVIDEILRVAVKNVVFFEYHEKSWWKRLFIRIQTGYNAYDYKKLLESKGCYNIQIVKMHPDLWPDTGWRKWGHIIIAQVPRS